MPLTDIAIKAIKPAEKIVRYHDEKGLYLEVSPAGGRWWRFKYSFDGKEKRLSLGTYPEVTLKAARIARDEFRQKLRAGDDPGAARKTKKREASDDNTFEHLARQWWSHWKIGKNPHYADEVTKRLEADIFTEIGAYGINAITTKDIVACIRKLEARGVGDLARKQLNKISQVFRYSIANDKAIRNPAADIKPADILKPLKKRNFARIKAADLPKLLKDIDEYDGKRITVLAMKIMNLTFVRTSPLINGEWDELDGDLWRIPPEKMKVPSPHIVPLARQTKALFEELRKITGEGRYMFPGEQRGQTMSNNTILYALYRMGYKSRMTGHGFRGVASTILHEQGWPHEHIELQLAHEDRDEISAAYNYALYLGPRAKMMQAWADFLDDQMKIAGQPI